LKEKLKSYALSMGYKTNELESQEEEI
jgi:hypothetical protein